jgi:hypothetical protein
MMQSEIKRKFKVHLKAWPSHSLPAVVGVRCSGEPPIPSIKAILQIVLSLDQLHG